jgi:hypothetical protein
MDVIFRLFSILLIAQKVCTLATRFLLAASFCTLLLVLDRACRREVDMVRRFHDHKLEFDLLELMIMRGRIIKKGRLRGSTIAEDGSSSYALLSCICL